MLESITSILAHNIITGIESASYLAIFIFMTLESAFVPIPSEITMPFAGFLVSQGKLNFWLVVMVGGFANLTGSLIVYFIGAKGQTKVHSWIKRYGKYLLISIDDVELGEKWFRSHGELVAFGSRLLPIVRTFISLPAGMARMNLKKFSIYSLAGALIWSAFLTYLGVFLGKNWNSLEHYFRQFQIVIIGIGALLIFLYVKHKIKKIKKQSA